MSVVKIKSRSLLLTARSSFPSHNTSPIISVASLSDSRSDSYRIICNKASKISGSFLLSNGRLMYSKMSE